MLSDNSKVSFDTFKLNNGLASPPPEKAAIQVDMTKFDALVDEIRRILGTSSGINSADVDVDQLMQVLRDYDQTAEHEWNKYALNDPKKAYTRNGVDDINKKANLMVLVWNPQRGSAVHDHADAHCIVKVLKGTIRETLYDWPEDEHHTMRVKRVNDYNAGGVTYMSDTLGLHRMENPDSDDVAVSLHLYTPPYAAKFGCKVFDEKTGHFQKVPTPLYSDKGVKIDRVGSNNALTSWKS